jgi:hypothetical protein
MLVIIATVAVLVAVLVPVTGAVTGHVIRTVQARRAETARQAFLDDRDARHLAWCQAQGYAHTPLPR